MSTRIYKHMEKKHINYINASMGLEQNTTVNKLL